MPITHGHKPKYGASPTYRAYQAMRTRTSNPNSDHYHVYGGRGIGVCARWRSFENFLADMGIKPEGMTLERKNNNRGYSPSNCKWALPEEQRRNTSRTVKLKYEGRMWPMVDLARHVGIKYMVLFCRVRLYGWSVERAINTPIKGMAT